LAWKAVSLNRLHTSIPFPLNKLVTDDIEEASCLILIGVTDSGEEAETVGHDELSECFGVV
jgi:hypothetical protein